MVLSRQMTLIYTKKRYETSWSLSGTRPSIVDNPSKTTTTRSTLETPYFFCSSSSRLCNITDLTPTLQNDFGSSTKRRLWPLTWRHLSRTRADVTPTQSLLIFIRDHVISRLSSKVAAAFCFTKRPLKNGSKLGFDVCCICFRVTFTFSWLRSSRSWVTFMLSWLHLAARGLRSYSLGCALAGTEHGSIHRN